jgi:hypothetical protein
MFAILGVLLYRTGLRRAVNTIDTITYHNDTNVGFLKKLLDTPGPSGFEQLRPCLA